MRLLIQRVSRAQASLIGSPASGSAQPLAAIPKGLLILAAFEEGDSPVFIEQMVQKVRGLRVFSDAAGKLNLSGPDVDAQYLLVSQFTLFADCKYGNRPSFTKAAPKARAKEYYEHFVQTAGRLIGPDAVKHTPFGADLAVELVNDGPITIWLDSHEVL